MQQEPENFRNAVADNGVRGGGSSFGRKTQIGSKPLR